MPDMLAEFELKILGRNADLVHVLKHHLGHALFDEQLQEDYCAENLQFWDAVEALKKVDDQAVFNEKAKEIRELYVLDSGDRQVNLKSENRKNVDAQFDDGPADVLRNVFLASQAEIYFLMENDCYSRFRNGPRCNKLYAAVGDYGETLTNKMLQVEVINHSPSHWEDQSNA